ncbi:MAG: hypothetical protein GXO35_03610 [Gammaproteobacteria bacterium]|nr:hypothetical protein [Gammaproteobacteria bacterium]
MKDKKFFVRSFFILFVIVGVILWGVFYYNAHNTPEYKIKERLVELGYPTEGYYYADSSVRYPDGRVVVFEDGKVENYTVNIYQATAVAYSLLEPYQSKLEQYNFTLKLDYESFTETYKDGTLYFVFPVKMSREGKRDNILVGYVFVDRKTGRAFIKGLLG